MAFSLEIPDNQVALWQYSPTLLKAIRDRSWKFWVIEYISWNPKLVEDLKSLWIFVGPMNPMVLNPWEVADDWFFERFNTQLSQIPDELKGYLHSDRAFHIRWGSPGDFKWLVDVLKTPVVTNATREKIRDAIKDVRRIAAVHSEKISRYAHGEWVYWDSDNIQIWVVPSFNVPIVTVTEDPNNEWRIFIDTLFPSISWNRIMSATDYIEGVWVTGDELQWELGVDLKKNDPPWENIQKAIQLLKNQGMLDPNMTYQFELWWLRWIQSWFLLFQIKEFARKNPVNTDHIIKSINNNYRQILAWGRISRIITGLREWDILNTPIIDGQYRWNIWQDTKAREFPQWFIMRPSQNRNDLVADDYHPDLKWFIHGDAWGGTLAHNSFRFAQSVVRKWWIITLWFYDPYEIRKPNINTLNVRVNNGILEQIWEAPTPIDETEDIIKRLGELK